MDFILAAMPWVAAGIMVALMTSLAYKKDAKSVSSRVKRMNIVAIIWFALALVEWFSTGQLNEATTYFSLGFMFIVLSVVAKRKEEGQKEEQEEEQKAE